MPVAFNLKKHCNRMWSIQIAKEEYGPNNFVLHNGERGIYCVWVPDGIVSKIEKRKTPGRWILYILHGTYPDFIFTDSCKRLGWVSENRVNPDKQKAKDLAIQKCKEIFVRGRFRTTDADLINAPFAHYASQKTAVHGLSPFNYNDVDMSKGNSWLPVNPYHDPYSPSSYTTHVPQFGGDTFGKQRRKFDGLSNGNNTNDEDEMKNTRHSDPATDYNSIWRDNMINKTLQSDKDAPNETWQISAPAGKTPDKAVQSLKEQFPHADIKIENGRLSILVRSIEEALDVEKHLHSAIKTKLH